MIVNARNLTPKELDITTALIDAGDPKWHSLKDTLPAALVSEMNDGEMGSLKFIKESDKDRKLGHVINEAEYIDDDGVTVSIALNLDEDSDLYELDIWKVDFSKLINLPNKDDLKFLDT